MRKRTSRHTFKIGQYYFKAAMGEVKEVVYKVVPCAYGSKAIIFWTHDCSRCKIQLMLQPIVDNEGFCCSYFRNANKIRKLTKMELLIRKL